MTSPQTETVSANPPTAGRGWFAEMFRWLSEHIIVGLNRTIPAELLTNPETTRQAKLTARFGFLGCFFGIAYATFYILIGHKWGAAIILVCSLNFAAAPLG